MMRARQRDIHLLACSSHSYSSQGRSGRGQEPRNSVQISLLSASSLNLELSPADPSLHISRKQSWDSIPHRSFRHGMHRSISVALPNSCPSRDSSDDFFPPNFLGQRFSWRRRFRALHSIQPLYATHPALPTHCLSDNHKCSARCNKCITVS